MKFVIAIVIEYIYVAALCALTGWSIKRSRESTRSWWERKSVAISNLLGGTVAFVFFTRLTRLEPDVFLVPQHLYWITCVGLIIVILMGLINLFLYFFSGRR